MSFGYEWRKSSLDSVQPFFKKSKVVFHNGILSNINELWKLHPKLNSQTEVDSEWIASMLMSEGDSLESQVKKTYDKIEGTASVAYWDAEQQLLSLSTNNGSLHYIKTNEYLAYASEVDTLLNCFEGIKFKDIVSIEANCAISFKLGLATGGFKLPPGKYAKAKLLWNKPIKKQFELQPEELGLKRCTRCVLPETVPNISFNAEGVCNFCTDYKKINLKSIDLFKQSFVTQNTQKHDCILALSGGRDSCYGLHYLVKELGIKPLVFSYDWGLVTDLGRRNQTRLCAKLGVEQILITANLKKKRDYVRRNINAWLKKPHLGLLPLFTAGDKYFFYHANQIRKKKLVLIKLFFVKID